MSVVEMYDRPLVQSILTSAPDKEISAGAKRQTDLRWNRAIAGFRFN